MKFRPAVLVLICSLFLCDELSFGYIVDHLPVFPQPRRVSIGGETTRQISDSTLSLSIESSSSSCTGECLSIIQQSYNRIISTSFTNQRGLPHWKLSLHPEVDTLPLPNPTSGLPKISAIHLVFIGSTSQLVPELTGLSTEDEWHDITIGTQGDIIVRVKTVWGAIHSFETLIQLFEWDDVNSRFIVSHLPLLIEDWPRFPWRGLMLDTSRHFLPLKKIKQMVDAVSAMKLNVIHLHLTDAQSFPFVVESVPGLAGKGSFNSKTAIYTHSDITELINYAKLRGVMILPEIDIPAHTGSWRFADEDLVADCWDYSKSITSVYQENVLTLNPANPKTFDTITKILTEVAHTFTCPYTHVGGDEVFVKCWETCKQKDAISKWMKQYGFTTYTQVEDFLDKYAQNASLLSGKRPIVWEDAFTSNHMQAKDAIIHVWRQRATVNSVVKAGYDVLLSAGYYLDRQAPTCDTANCHTNWMFSWTARDMYAFDPIGGLQLSEAELKHVLGGEAAMWAESVDQVNIDTMALSRLVAVAERFWSESNITDPNNLEVRTQRFRCLSLRRGISGAGSQSSDYCEYNWPFPQNENGNNEILALDNNNYVVSEQKKQPNVVLISIISALGGFVISTIGSIAFLAYFKN